MLSREYRNPPAVCHVEGIEIHSFAPGGSEADPLQRTFQISVKFDG
jgi:hypothetical protein